MLFSGNFGFSFIFRITLNVALCRFCAERKAEHETYPDTQTTQSFVRKVYFWSESRK